MQTAGDDLFASSKDSGPHYHREGDSTVIAKGFRAHRAVEETDANDNGAKLLKRIEGKAELLAAPGNFLSGCEQLYVTITKPRKTSINTGSKA
ncbi:unnamed protein product [Victoria cruziana]